MLENFIRRLSRSISSNFCTINS